jgi:hypothetical protein
MPSKAFLFVLIALCATFVLIRAECDEAAGVKCGSEADTCFGESDYDKDKVCGCLKDAVKCFTKSGCTEQGKTGCEVRNDDTFSLSFLMFSLLHLGCC